MEHKIKIPEGCQVVVSRVGDMAVIEIAKDEPKFKENDIVFLDSVESVMIFDYIDDSDVIHTKCFYSTLQKKLSTKTINVCGKMRFATEYEKQLLFDKLKEKCLMFDGKDIVRWMAEKNEGYYCVFGNGEIIHVPYFGACDGCDESRFDIGNHFPTKEMAEAYKIEFLKSLENFRKSL